MTLDGVIETHVHAAPDVRVRSVDDWGIVDSAEKAGIRAVVIKNHFFPTVCRAADMQKVAKKVKIFGGIALNYSVGGVNPYAVEKAIALGAKVIWLPTHDAGNHYAKHGKAGGLTISPNSAEAQNLESIIDMVKSADVVLATGHLSSKEIMYVADRVVARGVKKFVVTHPELWIVGLSIDEQRQLISTGALFERVYAQPITPGNYHVNVEDNYRAIMELGYETTVVSTDGGQVENPFWTTSLQNYVNYLEEKGLSQEALDRMTKINPSWLLGLD